MCVAWVCRGERVDPNPRQNRARPPFSCTKHKAPLMWPLLTVPIYVLLLGHQMLMQGRHPCMPRCGCYKHSPCVTWDQSMYLLHVHPDFSKMHYGQSVQYSQVCDPSLMCAGAGAGRHHRWCWHLARQLQSCQELRSVRRQWCAFTIGNVQLRGPVPSANEN